MKNAAIDGCPPVEVDADVFASVWTFRGWEPCDPPPPEPDPEAEPVPLPTNISKKKE